MNKGLPQLFPKLQKKGSRRRPKEQNQPGPMQDQGPEQVIMLHAAASCMCRHNMDLLRVNTASSRPPSMLRTRESGQLSHQDPPQARGGSWARSAGCAS